jgi:hyperosmotically inducible periplasmic protein
MITPRFRLIAAAVILGSTFLAACNKAPSADTTPTTPTSPTLATAETDDATVTGKVQMELLSNEALKGLAITVVTTKGDVRIAGQVMNQEQADQVEKLVRAVAGVHSLRNELTIKK